MNRHLVCHGGRRRSWSRRISEHMQIGKRQTLDEAAAFFKQLVGFTGKTCHYVSANCSLWHGFMYLSDLLGVVPWPVFAVHPPQNMVTAGLQRNMSMLGDPWRLCHQSNKIIAPVHGLNRADADFFNAGMLQKR